MSFLPKPIGLENINLPGVPKQKSVDHADMKVIIVYETRWVLNPLSSWSWLSIEKVVTELICILYIHITSQFM